MGDAVELDLKLGTGGRVVIECEMEREGLELGLALKCGGFVLGDNVVSRDKVTIVDFMGK